MARLNPGDVGVAAAHWAKLPLACGLTSGLIALTVDLRTGCSACAVISDRSAALSYREIGRPAWATQR